MISTMKKSQWVHAPVLAVFVLASAAAAQVPITNIPPLKTREMNIRTFQERQLLESARIIMGGPIDAEKYRMGPGDELMVTIGGTSPEIAFPLVVLPEGVVNIPDIAGTPLNGLSLAESRSLIKRRLKTLYPESHISVTLTNLRIFIVRLTGEINEPGIRYANATWRVSDVLEQSGGLTKWANFRNIQIRHQDDTVEIYDSWKYYNYGHQDNNPLLRDGDEVYVPGRNFSQGSVIVRSSNYRSGFYQFYQDETVFEFIKRGNFDTDRLISEANLTDKEVNPLDLDNVTVIRENREGMPDTLALSISPDDSGDPFIGDFTLQPGDILVLPVIKNLVFVDGEVRFAGSLEWVTNRRAGYYVGIAGRSSNAAGDDFVVVVRKNTKEKIVGNNPVIYPGDHIFVPKRKMLVIKDWLDFISPVVSILLAAKAIGVY